MCLSYAHLDQQKISHLYYVCLLAKDEYRLDSDLLSSYELQPVETFPFKGQAQACILKSSGGDVKCLFLFYGEMDEFH